eukprot:CAMPEP_0204526778 /NCGR_PEP_ID=MMETSP0661-20131031/8621_1 /ASSEMBLY_ACC=CAM_ASM_000606 /TAXON_ID=109239 /ORGANISM="Alexandrium margalefi, Strain AMGDE01CS-322" /LENGTH=594 /DNA_ID=CAMNT_0051532639 /DNA_START=55 /DNA_END=1839 /DNA_ORIENTATION=+
MATGNSSFEFEYTEVRAGSWNAAADEIILKLKQANVRRGQIVSIDAHNNGPDELAIFSAHFSRQYPDHGELDIEYLAQNTDEAWAAMYERVAKEQRNHSSDSDISITSSCNAGGRGVTYVFRYKAVRPCGEKVASVAVDRRIVWVEERGGSWHAAAEGIVRKIKATGAQKGQVIGIDAHLNVPTGEPVFSAFVDLAAPSLGQLDLGFCAQLDRGYGWAVFYTIANAQAAFMSREAGDVISITSSINPAGRSETFTFADMAGRPNLEIELEYVEVRANSWDRAADGIIEKLRGAGVKRGQIVSIDAHSNGPSDDAIFSAHFSRRRADGGELAIEYSAKNKKGVTNPPDWEKLYERAAAGMNEETSDVISITSCCSSGHHGFTYVFKYALASDEAPKRNVVWLRAEGDTWDEAAQDILNQIRLREAQKGQILGIDAHVTDASLRPTLSAFLDLDAPGLGPVDLTYAKQLDRTYGWASYYEIAHFQAATMGSADDIISITGSINGYNISVMLVFVGTLSKPKLVLTVEVASESSDAVVVACTDMAGSEVASVRLQPGASVGDLRAAVAASVDRSFILVLPDGRRLREAEDSHALAEA